MAIEAVCAYKFFRVKDIKLGIFSTIYFLIPLILTLSYFFSRNVLVEMKWRVLLMELLILIYLQF